MLIFTEMVNYISVIISQIIIIMVFYKLIGKKAVFNRNINILIFLSSFIEVIAANNINPSINSLICLGYFIALFKVLIKYNWKEIIFYIFVIWLIAITSDILIMLVINTIHSYFNFINPEDYLVRSICSIIMILLVYVFANQKWLQKIIIKGHKLLLNIKISYLYILIILLLYFTLGVISIANAENKQFLTMILILAVLFFLSIVQFCGNKYHIFILKQTNELLIKNNEFYIKLIDDYRILKHNLISQLLGIKSVSSIKAKKLIDELIMEYSKDFRLNQNIKDIPYGLDGIIYEKIYNFKNNKKLNIIVNNNINNKILNIISPKNYNLLCEALGVTIDNAMNAAIKSKEKVVVLKFNEFEDKIKVIIINTFKGFLDLDKIGNLKSNSRITGHGYGLFSLISKRRLKIKTVIKNNLFINEIEINKIKK